MDKELQLVVNFDKAPKDLQDAAKAHYDNILRLARIQKQKSATDAEAASAEKAHGETAKVLRVMLAAWTPEVE